MDKILVTSALPYANGHLHLGHMVEHIQVDIWVRALKLFGHDATLIGGDDAHGTPIMLKADGLNISPKELTETIHKSHLADLKDFLINYDEFHTTDSPENKELAELIYLRLKENNDVERRTIKQAFDQEKQMFLPDRYVKGQCPKCQAEEQYGDSCEKCGATYSPSELINPLSVLSNTKPIEKESEHLFFKLPNYEAFLKEWTSNGALQSEIGNKLSEWFEAGLRDWDISRDAPYFGFEIPGEKDKYFYVWLDAPIGYMASFKKFCQTNPEYQFDDYWKKGSNHKLYHFIGKDIIYFHALFWPAMLEGSGFKTPDGVFTHGFLTLNGQKMSKSRGTFVNARSYLNHLPAEALRYYFAAKLTSGIEDLDLNLEDFKAKINSDLVGKVVNIASRCSGFIHKNFEGRLSDTLHQASLFETFSKAADEIKECYLQREFSRTVRLIMELSALANQYINEQAPWKKIKEEGCILEVHQILTTGINLFRLLILYLKPILPELCEKAESFLECEPMNWEDAKTPLLASCIAPYKPLFTRLESGAIDAMLNDEQNQPEENKNPSMIDAFPLKDEITIDDFMKLDLRIAKIVEAKPVPEADKLIQLQLDIGGETKQVFAGIKAHFEPESLVGKHTVMVANLKPRKMRFGLSEGMVVLAGNGKDLYLISPEDGASAGMPVK